MTMEFFSRDISEMRGHLGAVPKFEKLEIMSRIKAKSDRLYQMFLSFFGEEKIIVCTM